MCGIAGYIGKHKISQSKIARTIDSMKNRGPDHQNWKSFQKGSTHIYLLHSRLSIIDLGPRANQPLKFRDYNLVFNGEIYNYIEIRKTLQRKGYEFVTSSDTEVLLMAYAEYGEECVNYFEGMWAFAIWDEKESKLFLSRDRFSEKPLYLMQTDLGLYFGSEIKFIHSLYGKPLTINHTQLTRYLTLGYKSLGKHNDTFFNEISEVKSGSNLIVFADLNKRHSKYWQPTCQINTSLSLGDAVDGAKHYLIESMKMRLRSDVPIAFCLSGGVDSSALISIATKHFNQNASAFSVIDHDERYNEKKNIQRVVNDTGCASTFVTLSHSNSLTRLENLIAYHDAPISTVTYLIHSMLSEQIACGGYRVSVSGIGGDELFSGYYDHSLLHLNSVKNSSTYKQYLEDWKMYILPHIRNPVLRNPLLYQNNPQYRKHNYDASDIFTSFLVAPFKEEFIEKSYTNNLMRNRMLNELFDEVTPIQLHEDDHNSMFYSVENRSPFLDSKLFDFMFSVPDEYLIQNGYSKYILRESMKEILVSDTRLDRHKKGFNASINSLFDFSDKDTVESLLEPSSPIFEIVDWKSIADSMKIDPAPNHYSKFLFNFINCKMFLEHSAMVQ